MATVFITRAIPEIAERILRDEGHTVVVSDKNGVLGKGEFITLLKRHNPDAVIALLTDTVDAEVLDAAPKAKIFANYAVGFDNIDLVATKERGVIVTNTPGVLTDTVAEFAAALVFSITKRIPEADSFTRAGKYDGWAPMLLLGSDLKGKTLGILGAGRIGSRVGEILGKGAGMSIIYYDVQQSPEFEAATGARFCATPEEVLAEADIVSVHVPLLPTTRHLIDARRLSLMKKGAYLINTSRGPVVDEAALVVALKAGAIRGAALDVFEFEPKLAEGLCELSNVVLTPHIASASEETRTKMAEIAARNVATFLKGGTPPNIVSRGA